jgi:C1A family cysteine protease
VSRFLLPNGYYGGWQPEPPDHRDQLLKNKFAPRIIPEVVELNPEFYPDVRDQGALGSCTGQATTGALMYKLRQRDKQHELSPLYAYYRAREMEGTIREDAGAFIRDVIKGAGKHGVALESCWPYEPRKFARKPTKRADKSAAAHQAVRYYRCLTVDDILQALANDLPVVGGFSCFSSLNGADVNATGRVPMPQGRDDALEGGHAVWFVRGEQNTRYFKFQNSWALWGDQGYGYLPFEYVNNGLADDFWAVDHE